MNVILDWASARACMKSSYKDGFISGFVAGGAFCIAGGYLLYKIARSKKVTKKDENNE